MFITKPSNTRAGAESIRNYATGAIVLSKADRLATVPTTPMTPAEMQWIKNGFALIGRQNIDRIAECHVLTEFVADVMSQLSDRDASFCRAEIRDRIKERQEQYLLEAD